MNIAPVVRHDSNPPTIARPAAVAVAAALIAVAAMASPAFANDRPQVFQPDAGALTDSVAVQYSPAELSSPAGARALYHRIEAAADSVCSPSSERELVRHAPTRDCAARAVDTAVRSVGAATLSAIQRDAD